MTEEQKVLADSYTWFHRIKLSEDYTTKGICDHGNDSDFESRFGFPKSFEGANVLDVGTYDGLFSFEAKKRGSSHVTAIDMYQGPVSKGISTKDANAPFRLADEVLQSNVFIYYGNLEDHHSSFKHKQYDYIFHFGILYHVENPLQHVRMLMDLVAPGGTILVETAIDNSLIYNVPPALVYKPGFDNDPTNIFYPNKEWVIEAFKQYGAKSVECFYNDGVRATFRVQA